MEYRVQVKVVDWDLGWIDVLVAHECEYMLPCYPGVHLYLHVR